MMSADNISRSQGVGRMRKFFGSKGSVSRVTIESQALKSNMLGDPPVRVVDVYLPAGHDGQGLPLLVDLVGFTGSGLSHTNWVGFRENLPERLDRLIGERRMPPVVVAFPDCFTRLGGNQYINSASMGAWEDFLLHEMLPAIEQRFRCGGSGRRGVFGKSSGGYGAITHALRHSDLFTNGGVAHWTRTDLAGDHLTGIQSDSQL